MTNRRLLNLGCGAHFDSRWVNVDFSTTEPEVISHDLRRGIPFSGDKFDACYHSHVLEHFEREVGKFFIEECYRVLCPGGKLRVVVPSLQDVAQAYLDSVDRASRGKENARYDHEWMIIELIDQMVRTSSGGYMSEFLCGEEPPNKEFVRSRLGPEYDRFRQNRDSTKSDSARDRFLRAIGRLGWREVAARIFRKGRNAAARLVIWMISGNEARVSFEESVFRQKGEVHRWMYDSVSLGRLLERVGFVEIEEKRADESGIENFDDYDLDVVDGHVRKPNSLFLEAKKPWGSVGPRTRSAN